MTLRTHSAVSALCIVATCVSGAAHADLVGSSVTVTGLYPCASAGASGPTGCSIFGGPETHTIGSGGTNFTTLAFDGLVRVTGDELIWNATTSIAYAGPSFNGFEFQISGAPSIASFKVDATTNLGPATNNYASGGLLINGDTVWMDLNSLSAVSGQKTIFDLCFKGNACAGTGVPEPATLTLLGFGLVGLSLARRKRKS